MNECVMETNNDNKNKDNKKIKMMTYTAVHIKISMHYHHLCKEEQGDKVDTIGVIGHDKWR